MPKLAANGDPDSQPDATFLILAPVTSQTESQRCAEGERNRALNKPALRSDKRLTATKREQSSPSGGPRLAFMNGAGNAVAISTHHH